MPPFQIVPSLLSANQSMLDEEVREIEKHIDRVQFDVMDGAFVKPTAQTVDDVKKLTTGVPSEIHLMVVDPLAWIDDFIDVGASLIIIHAEIGKDINAIMGTTKKMTSKKWEMKAGMYFGDKLDWESTRGLMAWSFLLDAVHHRGQLSTYIRPMGGKVPSIYGPSGDSK